MAGTSKPKRLPLADRIKRLQAQADRQEKKAALRKQIEDAKAALKKL